MAAQEFQSATGIPTSVSAANPLPVTTSGGAASGAAAVGNPVQVGGVYNSSAPTLDNGDVGALQLDVQGNEKVTLATGLAGENLTAQRMMMSRPGTSTRITTATTTTARSGTGVITRFLIEAALTGTATVYDNTAASGTILTILPIGFAAGSHQADISFGTGCTVVTSAADRVVVVVEPN